jgi:hypothetical protein
MNLCQIVVSGDGAKQIYRRPIIRIFARFFRVVSSVFGEGFVCFNQLSRLSRRHSRRGHFIIIRDWPSLFSLGTSPAVAAGLEEKPWSLEKVVELTEEYLRRKEDAQFEEAFAELEC